MERLEGVHLGFTHRQAAEPPAPAAPAASAAAPASPVASPAPASPTSVGAPGAKKKDGGTVYEMYNNGQLFLWNVQYFNNPVYNKI